MTYTIELPISWTVTLIQAACAAEGKEVVGPEEVKKFIVGAVGEALGQFEASQHGDQDIESICPRCGQ